MQLCKKICKNYFDNTCQILSCKFFRFVLYQLSKNLNRPFFMDFLTQLSIRYTEKSAVVDEEDPDDQGEEIKCVCFWTTGCPTIEYSLCFGCFLGFQCSYRGLFYHFYTAQETTIPKLTLLSSLRQKLIKLQSKMWGKLDLDIIILVHTRFI